MENRGRLHAVFAVTSLVLALARDAGATDCTPKAELSTCFDADSLAPPFAPSDFLMMARARALPANTWTLGLDMTVLHHPVVLNAASPDPYGRDLPVVKDLFDATLTFALAPARHLELGAAFPFTIHRTGSGLSGVTSQGSPDLPGAAVRDLRAGAGYELFRAPLAGGRASLDALVRLDFSFPTGQESSFAGERSVVGAPAFDLGFRLDRFFLSLEERARLREPVAFGGARLGSQWVTALGAGYHALDGGRLTVAVEAFVAPYLSQADRTLPDGTRVRAGALVPSEWMLSARTRLAAFSVGLGGGTAIPLSRESRTSPVGLETTSTYAAVTSPVYRFVLSLRYVPRVESDR
jgi:hypothetical protein